MSASVASRPQDQRRPPARQLCELSGTSIPCRRIRTPPTSRVSPSSTFARPDSAARGRTIRTLSSGSSAIPNVSSTLSFHSALSLSTQRVKYLRGLSCQRIVSSTSRHADGGGDAIAPAAITRRMMILTTRLARRSRHITRRSFHLTEFSSVHTWICRSPSCRMRQCRSRLELCGGFQDSLSLRSLGRAADTTTCETIAMQSDRTPRFASASSGAFCASTASCYWSPQSPPHLAEHSWSLRCGNMCGRQSAAREHVTVPLLRGGNE